jgi:hypothetical protein
MNHVNVARQADTAVKEAEPKRAPEVDTKRKKSFQ